MAIYIFYHIYCCEQSVDIVKDQIQKILFSGTYDTVDKIYCFLAGAAAYIDKIIDILQKSGAKFCMEHIGINDTSYERFTIHKIKKYICADDKFLYIHTKGILRGKNQCITDWRTYMEYFVLRYHEKCIQTLDTYDTVGVNLQTKPFIHYSGNFWWSRGDYFLGLPDIETLTVANDRYSYTENYLGLNNPRAGSLFVSGVPDHYSYRYLYESYVDSASRPEAAP